MVQDLTIDYRILIPALFFVFLTIFIIFVTYHLSSKFQKWYRHFSGDEIVSFVFALNFVITSAFLIIRSILHF